MWSTGVRVQAACAARPAAGCASWCRRHPAASLPEGLRGHDAQHPQAVQTATRQRPVSCSANPRRIARVTKAMEREISNIMVTDDVVRDAITRNDGVTMCTCSGVDVSGDLQVVKVYIVVQSRDERARYAITKRLQGLTGYIRRLIGQRVQLRLTPEIRILYDDAAERGERVLQLLDSIKEEDEKKAALKRQAAGEDAEEEEEEEEEGFLDLDEEASSEDAAEASGGDKKKRKGGGTKPNPFLEGVGDPDYDSDAERPGGERPPLLLTPNMFPDAYPELDEMQAREKQSAWQRKQDGKKGGKYRIRRKHGS